MLHNTKCRIKPNSPGWLQNFRDILWLGLSKREGDTSTSLGETATVLTTTSISDRITLITISDHLDLSHQLAPAIWPLVIFLENINLSCICWNDHQNRDELPSETQLSILSLPRGNSPARPFPSIPFVF